MLGIFYSFNCFIKPIPLLPSLTFEKRQKGLWFSLISKRSLFFCTGSPEQKVALPEKENLIEGKKGLHVGVYHRTNWSSIKRNLSTGMNKAELQLARQNWYLLYKTSDLRRDFNKCELADKRTLESKVKDNKVVPRYPQFMWHTCQPWSKNVKWKSLEINNS